MNRNQIKYFAVIAMLIDHVATAFIAQESLLGMIMHFIGRFTAPTMAYFIIEGYHYTRNIKKYALRLSAFAVISWLPFSLFETGTISLTFGVIYTLFLGLLAVYLLDYKNCPGIIKVFGIVSICFISFFGDWYLFVPLWCIIFHIFRDKTVHKWIAYSLVGTVYCKLIFESSTSIISGLWCLGIYIVPFVIQFIYNGKSGSKRSFHKWFFYIFYPLHLIIILISKNII